MQCKRVHLQVGHSGRVIQALIIPNLIFLHQTRPNTYQMRLYFMFHLIASYCETGTIDNLLECSTAVRFASTKEWSMHATVNEKAWILECKPDSYWQGLKPEMLPRLKILTYVGWDWTDLWRWEAHPPHGRPAGRLQHPGQYCTVIQEREHTQPD